MCNGVISKNVKYVSLAEGSLFPGGHCRASTVSISSVDFQIKKVNIK